MMIAYHARNDDDGWHEVCRHEHYSNEWNEQDKVWINHMIEHGQSYLTCGWNMWQVILNNKGV